MDIIFVKTRWVYDSYIDYWKLVELSGFPICYTDEVDMSRDVVYIVSPYNGEWRPHIDSQRQDREFKATSYMINLERPGGSGSTGKYILDNQEHISLGYLTNIFVADKKLSEMTGFPYMMIGGHPEFGEIGTIDEKAYDLMALCCYSLPRAWMFQTPEMMRPILGGMSVATNAHPDSEMRHTLLRATRAMLNIHQDGLPFCEPLRMIIAVSYGLPIFSEECENPYNAYNFGINGFSYYSGTMRYMLKHEYDRLHQEAFINKQLFSYENSFYNCVLRAV